MSRLLCSLVSLLMAAVATTTAAQQTYPNKPIRVVVAFGPGGIADTIARLVGQKLSDRFGQSIVVDNRAGAGGTVGAKLVAAAAPDGYTLLVITAAVAINASASREAVDPSNQLTPIALAASAPTIFAVHRSVTAKNLMEFENASWIAFFAPAKAPAAVVRTLNTEINNALLKPDVRSRLMTMGFDPQAGSQAEFAAYLKSEIAKWAQVIKTTGITPN